MLGFFVKLVSWELRIVFKFRSSHLEVLHKKYLFWKFWKIFTKTPVVGFCFNKIARPVSLNKIGLQCGCFSRNFPKSVKQSFRYIWTAASVINLYLYRYLHIFLVHFHLNHSKSYGCSQVRIIIEIYHITLLFLLFSTYRPEIMSTDNGDLILCRFQLPKSHLAARKFFWLAFHRHATCWLHFRITY